MQGAGRFVAAVLASSLPFISLHHSALAAENPAQAGAPKVMTVTRPVAQFSRAEEALFQAAKAGDAAALGAMLTPRFECRYATAASRPVPRDEWLRITAESPPMRWALRTMAVHEHDDTAVVSFVLDAEPPDSRTHARQHFVVDVWVREQGAWKLDARYLSTLTGKQAQESSADQKNAQ